MTQSFPELIQLMNQRGGIVKQPVKYECLPITCTLCIGFGHDKHQYMKNVVATKKMWVPKKPITARTQEQIPVEIDQEDGLFKLLSSARRIAHNLDLSSLLIDFKPCMR